MRYGKRFIGLFTAVFLAMAVYIGIREYAWDGTVSLSVEVTSREKTEEIVCWEKNKEEYYIFLPSYAELSQVRLRTNTINPVYLGDWRLTDKMTCENIRLDVPYDLCYMAGGAEHHFALTFVQSGNVPTLYIDTASGSMEHIHEVKGNEEPGTLRLYTAAGELNHAGNLESIKGRGNSTWDMAKKPYNLTLYTEGNLLGMGAAQRWVLLANAADPSQMRNKIVYDFAGDVGLAYSPECEWVDLYLNGEYAGLYLLSERNEVHPERVDIGAENSFLVSKDWEWRFERNEQPFVMTQANVALRIHYSGISEDSLLSIWQSAENAILAEDGIDPVTGKHWRELIDLDTWAKKYLIEEIFGNPDAATLSQYFYYDGNRNEKIYAGPVWDFDLAMANTTAWPYPESSMFYANRPAVYGSPWFHALYNNEEFYRHVVMLYEAEFQPLLEKLIEHGMEDYTARVSKAAGMNGLRWGSQDPAEEAAAIQHYMTERIQFLNSVWLKGEEYLYVVVSGYDGAEMVYALRPGTCLPTLPAYESNESTIFYGWCNKATGEPFDIAQPVYEDTWIELKYEEAELPEAAEAEVQDPQPEENPSLLRLGPAILFTGMLAAVCVAGLKGNRRSGKEEIVYH